MSFSPWASRNPRWGGYCSHFSNEEAETWRGCVPHQRYPRLVYSRVRISARSSRTPQPVFLPTHPKERSRWGATVCGRKRSERWGACGDLGTWTDGSSLPPVHEAVTLHWCCEAGGPGGILQARVLEWWVAIPSSKGSSQPKDRTCVSHVSCIGRQVLYH